MAKSGHCCQRGCNALSHVGKESRFRGLRGIWQIGLERLARELFFACEQVGILFAEAHCLHHALKLSWRGFVQRVVEVCLAHSDAPGCSTTMRLNQGKALHACESGHEEEEAHDEVDDDGVPDE